ncbi:MAG: hypothetical protein ACKVRO_08070 [Micropepsaceae bacterium]
MPRRVLVSSFLALTLIIELVLASRAVADCFNREQLENSTEPGARDVSVLNYKEPGTGSPIVASIPMQSLGLEEALVTIDARALPGDGRALAFFDAATDAPLGVFDPTTLGSPNESGQLQIVVRRSTVTMNTPARSAEQTLSRLSVDTRFSTALRRDFSIQSLNLFSRRMHGLDWSSKNFSCPAGSYFKAPQSLSVQNSRGGFGYPKGPLIEEQFIAPLCQTPKGDVQSTVVPVVVGFGTTSSKAGCGVPGRNCAAQVVEPDETETVPPIVSPSSGAAVRPVGAGMPSPNAHDALVLISFRNQNGALTHCNAAQIAPGKFVTNLHCTAEAAAAGANFVVDFGDIQGPRGTQPSNETRPVRPGSRNSPLRVTGFLGDTRCSAEPAQRLSGSAPKYDLDVLEVKGLPPRFANAIIPIDDSLTSRVSVSVRVRGLQIWTMQRKDAAPLYTRRIDASKQCFIVAYPSDIAPDEIPACKAWNGAAPSGGLLPATHASGVNHRCDTTDGSSGSILLAGTKDRLVALHRSAAAEPSHANCAVPGAWIRRELSDVWGIAN